MTTTTIDKETLERLRYQSRRMRAALHPDQLGEVPPDRKEALKIQRRVDDILDRRPRPIATASDGEIIWSDASPLQIDQGTPIDLVPPTFAVNSAGQAEPLDEDVLTERAITGSVATLEPPRGWDLGCRCESNSGRGGPHHRLQCPKFMTFPEGQE